MSKFKAGDKVGYQNLLDGQCSGPHTVRNIDEHFPGGRVWFTEGTWMEGSRLFKWVEPGTSEQVIQAWNFSEAQRLREAAKAAVEAYNDYVANKPEDTYLKVYNPFQD